MQTDGPIVINLKNLPRGLELPDTPFIRAAAEVNALRDAAGSRIAAGVAKKIDAELMAIVNK